MRHPTPMLAALDSRLPVGHYWRYEPKLDGFRGLLARGASGQTHLLSRNARDLGPWFPEIVAAAQKLPPGTLLDGEIVMCDEAGWVDFGGLQERLSTARARVRDAVRQRPAALLAFDLLEAGGTSIQAESMAQRRGELERLLDGLHPCLQLVEQTADVETARDWLTLPSLEGVVAKRADRPYVAGRVRDWIKVKRQRTVDCVVVGLAGEVATPKLVLALRHADGELHHFAVTRPLPPESCRPMAGLLCEAGAQEPAIRSRWQHDAIPPWRRVPPHLVCEVRVSNLDAGRWARFPAVFMRWRPDRSADECGLDQLLS
jgi:ATP-dependent DNA ligase